MAKAKNEATATVVKEEVVRTDFLENKKVTVKYITKETNGIRDIKHVAYGGLLNGAEIAIPAPTLDNQKMKNLLTNDEKSGLEKVLGVNLSIYGDFWKEGGKAYEMGVLPVFLGKDDKILDLSDPYDYLRYKVLKACPIVANSLEEIKHRATNRFVITSTAEELRTDVEKGAAKAAAFRAFIEIENDPAILRYALRALGRRTNKSHKLEFLRSEMYKELDSNQPQIISGILTDPYLKTKVLLENCFEYGIVTVKDKRYYDAEGKAISDGEPSSLQVAAEYLASNLGQEERLALEAKLKNHLD